MLLFGALVRRKICVHKFIGSFLGCYTRDMITICNFFQLFADGACKLLISFFYKMKYVISSSVFVFTQSDLGCRCAKFGIWLHFSFYILLVSNSFCLLRLFLLFLGRIPWTIILICFCFNNIKIAAQINAFAMSLGLSRSRLLVI